MAEIYFTAAECERIRKLNETRSGLPILAAGVHHEQSIQDEPSLTWDAISSFTLVKVCAWCQKEQGRKPQPNQTHGICDRHVRELMAKEELL